jgi:hypothetical protein
MNAYDDFGGFSNNDDGEFGYDALINNIGGSYATESIRISEMQNFLRNQPMSLFNLAPNQQGEINFNGNLKPYTQLYILAIDVNSVAFRQVDIAEAGVDLLNPV